MRNMQILPAIRQWLFPPEFRIRPAGAEETSAGLAQLLRRAIDAQAHAVSELAELRNRAPSPASAVPPRLATALANEHFRLQRNAAQLLQDKGESRELRSMRRALDAITAALADHGIEYVDLTGQTYDPGRFDFEPIGAAEVVAGLDREQITRCERPAVLLHGKLLQTCKGLVARPA